MRKCLRACFPFFARFVLFFFLLHVSCATVTHYPVQTQNLISTFESGSPDQAFEKAVRHSRRGLNRLAYLLEGGMILHTGGRLQESTATFDEAEGVIRQHEEKAVLSLSKGTAQVGSLFVNEKTLPYQGEPFEKVLVNTYKAKNYLFLHDYDGARVEIRRSFARQRENEEMHRREVERVEQEARNKGFSPQGVFEAVSPH